MYFGVSILSFQKPTLAEKKGNEKSLGIVFSQIQDPEPCETYQMLFYTLLSSYHHHHQINKSEISDNKISVNYERSGVIR